MRIVAISGPVGTGKSTLARSLAATFGAKHLRTTQDFMSSAVTRMGRELPTDRRGLQDLGDQLDASTKGRWVADGVAEWAAENDAHLVVVDAVRIKAQVDLLRDAFGSDVHHIHLHASRVTLSERYAKRAEQGSHLVELTSYDEVAGNATEAAVGELHADADTVIDTDRSSQDDVVTRVAAALGLYGSRHTALVDVLIGGQYGSEGKGNIAFYLAPDYDVLVRVGGPNAGHKVPLDTPYTHVLLPSGTMANQTAKLVLGPGATLDVHHLLKEIADCQVERDRLFVDPQAMVIEQADIDSEQIYVKGIGSTGKGGGAAAARRITGRATVNGEAPVRLAKDVPELAPYIRRTSEVLDSAFERGERVLLEGTQGTALSLYHGHYPHVTSRDTTTAGCLAEAGIAPGRLRRVIMVCRTYPIRVKSPDEGTSGFMSQDLEWEVIAERSGVPVDELLEKEKGSRSGKQRRVAEFDWELLRRAAELNGATDIALTFTDYLNVNNREARRHDQLSDETLRFIEEVERVAQVPVSLIATRFHVRGIIDRRRW
jgi:adenylosuccinate synthase